MKTYQRKCHDSTNYWIPKDYYRQNMCKGIEILKIWHTKSVPCYGYSEIMAETRSHRVLCIMLKWLYLILKTTKLGLSPYCVNIQQVILGFLPWRYHAPRKGRAVRTRSEPTPRPPNKVTRLVQIQRKGK